MCECKNGRTILINNNSSKNSGIENVHQVVNDTEIAKLNFYILQIKSKQIISNHFQKGMYDFIGGKKDGNYFLL